MIFIIFLAKDPDKRAYLLKIEQDVNAINGLLDRFERCVTQQRDLLNHLQVTLYILM